MIKRILQIFTILSLVVGVFFIFQIRFAFKNYNEKDFQIPQTTNYTSWDEVFSNPAEVEVYKLTTGFDLNTNLNDPIYNSKEPVPVIAFGIKHINHGDLLIDTGYNDSFIKNPPYGNLGFFVKNYRKQHGLINKLQEGDDIISRLKENNLNPRKVFLTHMHLDHTAGLPSLDGNIEVIIPEEELNFFIYKMLTGNHLSGKKNILTLGFDKSQNIEPFDKVIDIFGDGSIWAINTSGHSAGHTSYLINSVKNKYFIIGDMVSNRDKFIKGKYANTDRGEEYINESKKSFEQVKIFKDNYPEVKILFSHGLEEI